MMFNPGDVVTLKSGGPQMTVHKVEPFRPANGIVPDMPEQVTAIRFEGDRPHSITGHPDMFVKADASDKSSVLPETQMACVELTAHLMRTKLDITTLQVPSVSYEGKLFGDVQIIVQKMPPFKRG